MDFQGKIAGAEVAVLHLSGPISAVHFIPLGLEGLVTQGTMFHHDYWLFNKFHLIKV